MSKKDDTVESYNGPAGGWGALQSTTKHLLQSDNAVRNINTLLKTNQPHGFDCPGCAWGEKHDPSRIRFCENGAKAVNWEATSRVVDRSFFEKYSVSWLKEQSDYFLEYQGRLTEPMRYNPKSDHYEPISWQEACNQIASKLKSLDSPNEAAFYTSGRASNEAAFLYQLFVRAYGTNNFPDCSNMCHEASGYALTGSIGIGKGTTTIEDFEHADAVFVFGQNPGTNHPRMLDTLREVVERGAQVLTFNTLRERGLERFQHPQNPVEMLTNGSKPLNTAYFTPKIGGDMAAIRGIVKLMLEMEDQGESVLDWSFINEHTQGVNQYLCQVRSTSWSHITEQSGLTLEELQHAANVYCNSDKVICTWAMGITQHTHSVATIHEIVNFLSLRGNIGKVGAGACPVRGHSNVQGDRTMGINERPADAFLDSLQSHFNFTPPREHGLAVVPTIQAMLEGHVKAFIALGGNFAAATPDTEQTYEALSNCDLNVQISTKLNRSHLVTCANSYILPCLGRTDIDTQSSGPQKVSVEDSFSMVHSSGGVVTPLSEQQKSEPFIIALLAQATLGKHPIDWMKKVENYDDIRNDIAQVIPAFSDFNERLKTPGGFYLGNSARDRKWNTPSKSILIHAHTLPESIVHKKARSKLTDKTLVLQTLRSHDQYNTTIYGLNDRYRGIKGERRVLFMNPADIERLGFKSKQLVDLTSLWDDDKTRTAPHFKVIPYDIPVGNIAAYYPETNPLVPLDSLGDYSFTPTSKSIAVELTASDSMNISIQST
ncbi:FdhF/YdeP family oxidoreductase [Marinomonas balearica]|uniref:Molybdopterin-dependent oxidoreductase alpha subunit n=1 Tax=Marinomonas balearica TaxID=491947 RepID=A0A4R6MD44_9GAMM|nr:FdhF/YdeP family oxidoreductase [Marinomonas balearica]TDO99608.1 molybdopterin-dependent oxidoreductase alpha subunit [Marinomonas balearica]